MAKATIHTYGRQWTDAQIVGTGEDNLEHKHDVLILRHPYFEHDVEFYAEEDEQGRHLNVGNAAFWCVIEGEEKSSLTAEQAVEEVDQVATDGQRVAGTVIDEGEALMFMRWMTNPERRGE